MRTESANGVKLNNLADIVPLETPMSLSITPSNICNLKCNYCYHGSEKKIYDLKKGKYQPVIIDKKMVDLIANQCEEFDVKIKQVTLVGGGEPLVNKDIVYIVKKMKKIAESVKLVTNATLLTPELSVQLVEAGLDLIKISFQGMTDEKYRGICGVDISVTNLIDQIRFFYKNRGDCKVHIKVVDIALEEGEESKFFDLFGNISDNLWIEHLSAVDEAGRWTSSENRWSVEIQNAQVCYFPFYYIFIDEYGNVYPCCNSEEGIRMGNIKEKSLRLLWKDEVRNLCISQLNNNIEKYPCCVGCKIMPSMMRTENYLDDKKYEILRRIIEK